MRKYLIVSILESDSPNEFQHSDWPLHTTLLRPFMTDTPSRDLAEILQSICTQHATLLTEGRSKELFGPDSDISVTELVNTPELQKLHEDIKSAYIDKIEFSAPHYPDFRPHVTENKGKSVQVGERLQLSALSLVELAPGGHKVLYTFQLK